MAAGVANIFIHLSCRCYCRGDLHHPLHSGVPDPLHVPPQRHLPHQRGQGQRRVRHGVRRHSHHRHRQPGDHRRIKEGVVHLTAGDGTLRDRKHFVRPSLVPDGGSLIKQLIAGESEDRLFGRTTNSRRRWDVGNVLLFVCFYTQSFAGERRKRRLSSGAQL